MHDIRIIREDPEGFDAALARRAERPHAAEIHSLDSAKRHLQGQIQDLQNARNRLSKEIGEAFANGEQDKANQLKAEVAKRKSDIERLEGELGDIEAKLTKILEELPNLPAPEVPDGADEADNMLVSEWGEKPDFDFTPQEHADLGPALGMEFDTGARLSGARFTFLRGDMARLHRALGQFMLDEQTRTNGYTECAPPLLVRDAAMYGTDKLPKFAQDSFQTREGYWLIPTSEVSLTASVAGEILEDAQLPLRLTALTPCFRSEAGAAGKDTRGFIRQHQFEKCELVAITRPEDSEAEHERMTRAAEGILQKLSLPYRKMLLCTGDMGFGAKKTYDLEVWLPGQGAWREISSCSNTGDFQARRMKTRFKREGAKKPEFVHTLNGSGLAVGRTLVAVIENYQREDGSIAVPEALSPYMDGCTRFAPAAG